MKGRVPVIESEIIEHTFGTERDSRPVAGGVRGEPRARQRAPPPAALARGRPRGRTAARRLR